MRQRVVNAVSICLSRLTISRSEKRIRLGVTDRRVKEALPWTLLLRCPLLCSASAITECETALFNEQLGSADGVHTCRFGKSESESESESAERDYEIDGIDVKQLHAVKMTAMCWCFCSCLCWGKCLCDEVVSPVNVNAQALKRQRGGGLTALHQELILVYLLYFLFRRRCYRDSKNRGLIQVLVTPIWPS